MSVFSKEGILKVLSAYNPWWRSGDAQLRQTPETKRFAFSEAMRLLENPGDRRPILLTGAHQTGKSTILCQMIAALLKGGTSPRRILLIPLKLALLRQSALSEILECYHEAVYPGEDVTIFCDELPFARDWAKWLKSLSEGPSLCRVIASASASRALMKSGPDAEAGRWAIVRVPPLSFYEYCEFLKLERPALPQGQALHWTDNMDQLSGVQKYFPRYLATGGFPAAALSSDTFGTLQTIREKVLDKALHEDLPALYNIRNTAELERAFLLLCASSSEIITIETLARDLRGLSRPTLENYLLYLESANLICQSRPIGLGGEKVQKGSPKIYLADNLLRSAVLMDDTLMTDAVQSGRAVEAAVYRHLLYHDRHALSVGYYRGAKRGRVIDIVVRYPGNRAMLLDVKYADDASVSDRDEIAARCGEAASAMVLTKHPRDYGVVQVADGKQLLRIPAFAFLYLLGYQEKNRT